MFDEYFRKRRNARDYNRAAQQHQADPVAQALQGLGLGQQQPAGYGVMAPGYATMPGEQPAGYGVLLPSHLTDANATNAAAGPAGFGLAEMLAGLQLIAAGSARGQPDAPPPMPAPQYQTPRNDFAPPTMYDDSEWMERENKRKRRRRGLLGDD